MKIGAILIIPTDSTYQEFIGLKCGKGRGYIFPGGKVEPNEHFHDAACREAMEEVGINVLPGESEFLFAGCPHGETFTYAFIARPVYKLDHFESKEGVAMILSRRHLVSSQYGGFYRVLFDIIDQRYAHRPEVGWTM